MELGLRRQGMAHDNAAKLSWQIINFGVRAGYNVGAKRAVRADVGRRSISLSRCIALFLADIVWGKRCQSYRPMLVTAEIGKAASRGGA